MARVFQHTDFHIDYAEALNRQTAATDSDALRYVNQFVYLHKNSAELSKGYLPENYADELVRLRDEEVNSRDFSAAVNNLVVDGNCSQAVNVSLQEVALRATIDNSTKLRDSIIDNRSTLDDNQRKTLYALRDILEDNRGEVRVYLPEHLVEFVKEEAELI